MVHNELRSRTLAGVNPQWSKRKRRLYTPVESLTIKRAGTASPRDEIPYYTPSYFLSLAIRYAWRKLSSTAELHAQRPTPYRLTIPVTTIEHRKDSDGVMRPMEVTRNRVITRKANFDTNLLDDCVQQSFIYWWHKGFEPHAAMFFGTRHHITATQRLKVVGNTEKALDTMPKSACVENRLKLQSSENGEMMVADLNLDKPNLVELVFTDIKPPSKDKNGRKPSPAKIAQLKATKNANLIRDLKDWFREAPTEAEQERMDELKEEKRDWNEYVKEIRSKPKQRFLAAIDRLRFGPPTEADTQTIRDYRAFLRHTFQLNRSWKHGFAGMTNSLIVPTKTITDESYWAARILTPSIVDIDEQLMVGAGMGI